MLKTNSKKAKENLYFYIRENCADYLNDNYGIDPAEIAEKKTLYAVIFEIFKQEMKPTEGYNAKRPTIDVFYDWAQGLAMGGLFCYYYNRPAKKDLSEILEETETEAEKFTEEQAERKLTSLIFHELVTR